MIEIHDDVLMQKNLPRVGLTVRSRKYGTLWLVMDKGEMWMHTEDDPET